MQTLLDNSILIIFLMTFLFLTVSKFRHQMSVFNLTAKELLQVRYQNYKLELPNLYVRLTAALIYTFLASIVVFRCLWSQPAFHTIVLCMLTHNIVLSIARRIL